MKTLAILGMLFFALPALARPELVVFEANDAAGPGTGLEIRKEIVEAIQKRPMAVHVMRLDLWKAAAKRKKLSGKAAQTVAAIKKVAVSANVDNVLMINVARKGSRFLVTARLYDQGGREIWSKGASLVDGMLGDGADKLAGGVFSVLGAGGAEPAAEPAMDEGMAEEPAPMAEAPPNGGMNLRDMPPPGEGGDQMASDDPGMEGGMGMEEGGEMETSARATGPSTMPLLRIQVGVPVAMRDYQAVPTPAGPGQPSTGQPINYTTETPYLGMALDVEITPMRNMSPALRGLGFAGAYSRGFVKSKYTTQAQTGGEFSSADVRYFADVFYRYTLNPESKYATQLGGRLGYGGYAFEVDQNPVLKESSRATVRVGGEILQPVYPPFLTLRVMGLYLPTASPGDVEKQAYGPEATGSGYEIQGGLRGELPTVLKGLGWTVNGVMVSFSDEFTGAGLGSPGAWSAGGKAEESYMGAVAGVSYTY
jgi:hypothetical protein